MCGIDFFIISVWFLLGLKTRIRFGMGFVWFKKRGTVGSDLL